MSATLDNGPATSGAATLQLLAQAMQRDAASQQRGRNASLPDAAALFDLSQRLLTAETPSTVYRILADGLKELTGARSAIVASVRRNDCQIEAVAHIETFDRNAEAMRGYRNACLNVLAGKDVPADELRSVSFVAADGRLQVIGLIEYDPQLDSTSLAKCLGYLRDGLSPTLTTKLAALEQSRFRRAVAAVARAWRIDRRLAWILAAAATVNALMPRPYQVRCDCEVEPDVRRHVAAPFDGVLQQSLCQPGDVVAAGQVLGKLDAKELNWEIAGIRADRDRATKSRDVNLSAGKTASAQIDRLEAQRLDERRKLLEHRLENLDVKSPIAGVVVSGDLDRVEGAPVKIGQSLYEVAPLDRMVVDVLVPETEIERVAVGQKLSISLDSHLGTTLVGSVSRIYPRAEVRDEANVFVIETVLDNADGKLRPGMKGRAAVSTAHRPLAWIALHRACETAYRWLW